MKICLHSRWGANMQHMHLQPRRGGLKTRLISSVAAIVVAATNMAPLSAAAEETEAHTPIKHVIVIIGENRSFDHIFATYKPVHGQTDLEFAVETYRQCRRHAGTELQRGCANAGLRHGLLRGQPGQQDALLGFAAGPHRRSVDALSCASFSVLAPEHPAPRRRRSRLPRAMKMAWPMIITNIF